MAEFDLALYQPDIAGNTGTILRMAACLGVGVHIIEPAGFDMSDRALRRAGMDYVEMAALTRHVSWEEFQRWRLGARRRLVLLTTKAETSYLSETYLAGDVMMFGRESAGVPEAVHEAADIRVTIPMPGGGRSLNLAVAAAMAAGEAMRQLAVS